MPTPKAVLITDLDNTLFDWVKDVARGVCAAVRGAAARLGLDAQDLAAEVRGVNRRDGTSEYAFPLTEPPCVVAGVKRAMVAEAFAAELAAFYTARRATLRLYPGIAGTLAELKRRGTPIVCHTESLAIHTARHASRVGGPGSAPRRRQVAASVLAA